MSGAPARWRARLRASGRWLALLALLALLAMAARALYATLPRHYALTISGGGLSGDRHLFAKALQNTAAANGVTLTLRPSGGSQEALALVAQGKLDFALVQGGLDLPYPGVAHVATLAPELLHFLVQPGIADFTALRGKRINLNSQAGGTRLVAKPILRFAGLREGLDYIETNLSTEQLLSLPRDSLPDAIVVTAFAPSEVVDFLVRQHGYTLLEIPFASAFALRHGWAADSRIGAYTYSVAPPVPSRDIGTIGVNLRLVTNQGTEADAVFKVLGSLFDPQLTARLPMHLDESNILASASYPPAEGTKTFMKRNTPVWSHAALDRAKAGLGFLVSACSTVLVIVKWFKQTPLAGAGPASADQTLRRQLAQLAGLEADFGRELAQGALTAARVAHFEQALSGIKSDALATLGKSACAEQHLPHSVLMALADARGRVDCQRLALSLRAR
ncbi:MAG: TAXI family TRAP transporter solute-binding subunit [Pseudomonadota bacterium]